MGSHAVESDMERQMVLGDLVAYFKKLGKVPSRREYSRLPDRPHATATIERLISWGAMKQAVAEALASDTPPMFEKSTLVEPKRLDGDDFDRLAIMAGLKEVGLPRRFRQMLANLVMSTEEALLKLPRYTLQDKSGSDLETAVLLLSDLHSGRRHFDDRGSALYNQDIMVARIGLVKEGALQIIDDRIRLGRLDELCVLLLGDVVDGSGIFPGQELHQDLTCYVPQICLVVACIWDLIVEVRTRFNIPVRIKGVRGNHGRQYKYCVANNNFDNLVFHLLYMMAVTYDPHGVEIEYSAGAPYLNFEIKGFNCHIRHEAPVQTETPAARAKFLGWKQIHDYSMMFYGHKHHPGGGTILDADVFMNGCLMMIDDLAESMGVFSRPSQKLVGIKPGVGLTYQYNLYADRFGEGGEANRLLKKYPHLQTPLC